MSSSRRPPTVRGVHTLSRDERLARLERFATEISMRVEYIMGVIKIQVHDSSPLALTAAPIVMTLKEAYAEATAHVTQAHNRPHVEAQDDTHDHTPEGSAPHRTGPAGPHVSGRS